jgi:hypothetical protein
VIEGDGVLDTVSVVLQGFWLLRGASLDKREEAIPGEVGKDRNRDFLPNSYLSFCQAALCTASIYSASRLFCCFVLARI